MTARRRRRTSRRVVQPSTWGPLRARYAALFAASGRTQEQVARVGGLSSQAAVSKLLANVDRGPTLDVFVKAVRGLGVSLPTFFEPWADEPPSPPPPPRVFVTFNADAHAALVAACVDVIRTAGLALTHDPTTLPTKSEHVTPDSHARHARPLESAQPVNFFGEEKSRNDGQ